MTRQITVKLNSRKFGPILDNLQEHDKFSCKTYSEVVAKAIYFVWVMHNESCMYLKRGLYAILPIRQLGLTSTSFTPEDREAASLLGADSLLTMPFNFLNLKTLLDTLD